MEYQKKVIVLGDVGVGKTSFVARVTEGRFINEHKSTVGGLYSVPYLYSTVNILVDMYVYNSFVSYS